MRKESVDVTTGKHVKRSPFSVLGAISFSLVTGAVLILALAFLVLASAAFVLIPVVLGILIMEWERVNRRLRKAVRLPWSR